MVRFLAILFLFPLFIFSRTENIGNISIHPIDLRNCQSSFKTVRLGSNDPALVEQYIRQHFANIHYGYSNVSVKLLNNIESQAGFHLQYQQLYKNIPIYRGQVKVNLDKKGNIISAFDNSFFTGNELPDVFPDTSLATRHFDNTVSTYKVEKNYFFDGSNLLPLIRVEISKKEGAFYEFFIDKNGSILYWHDLNSYYQPKAMTDSIIQASVFMPDPLTSAGVIYAAPYADNDNTDVSELLAQQVTVNLKVDFSNDTFRLQSPYVVIINISSPSTKVATTKTNFIYTRSQSGFEDVNVFYHVNVFQEYLQSLGFSNLVNYQLRIDTHGNNGDDQSLFNPGNPGSLQFGEGGVDDAEDADVIIHEYSHAISYSAAPGTNTGTERQTLDEANGDYLASSYSKSINPYHWEQVFTWDGHNEFWNGRWSVSAKHYPEDLVLSTIYKSTDIWSATLMQINNDIGREITDKLLLESMYGYSVGMKMTDAASLFLNADSALYAGVHYNNICETFKARGLSVCAVGVDEAKQIEQWVSLLNSQDFGESEAELRFNKSLSGYLELRDVTGKILLSDVFSEKDSYKLNGTLLAEGLYVLTVRSGLKTANFKLVRF